MGWSGELLLGMVGLHHMFGTDGIEKERATGALMIQYGGEDKE